MKNSVKIISLVIVMSIIATMLLSCGASGEDIVGTWKGTWTYNGATYENTICIYNDGTYSSTTYKNGLWNDYESGGWEIDGKEVRLYEGSITYKGSYKVYKYKNGNLVNNNHTFKKS